MQRRRDETAGAWPVLKRSCHLSHLCPPPRFTGRARPPFRLGGSPTRRDRRTEACVLEADERCEDRATDANACPSRHEYVLPTLRQTWLREKTRSRNVRSRCRCSMWSAIHINSRNWLRSSSTHEPSDPPHRVVIQFVVSTLSRGATRAPRTRRRASRPPTGGAERKPGPPDLRPGSVKMVFVQIGCVRVLRRRGDRVSRGETVGRPVKR